MCLLSNVNKVVISAFTHSNNIYIMQKNNNLETLSPNQHPPTKINPWCCTIIFLSQMEKQKTPEISIVNASSGSLDYGRTLLV
jgi:hypothetical protein